MGTGQESGQENARAEEARPDASAESAMTNAAETGAQTDSGAAPQTGAEAASGSREEKILEPERVEDGKRVYAADQLENVPFRTSLSQKVFIGAAILVLIAIAVTFHDAGSRENQAAQATFSVIAQPLINSATDAAGLRASYGYPAYTLNAGTKEADLFVEFLHGPIPPEKAALFGLDACGRLARAYVQKGYMPRRLSLSVYSRQENGPRRYYGKAIFNGNLDDLAWENSTRF